MADSRSRDSIPFGPDRLANVVQQRRRYSLLNGRSSEILGEYESCRSDRPVQKFATAKIGVMASQRMVSLHAVAGAVSQK